MGINADEFEVLSSECISIVLLASCENSIVLVIRNAEISSTIKAVQRNCYIISLFVDCDCISDGDVEGGAEVSSDTNHCVIALADEIAVNTSSEGIRNSADCGVAHILTGLRELGIVNLVDCSNSSVNILVICGIECGVVCAGSLTGDCSECMVNVLQVLNSSVDVVVASLLTGFGHVSLCVDHIDSFLELSAGVVVHIIAVFSDNVLSAFVIGKYDRNGNVLLVVAEVNGSNNITGDLETGEVIFAIQIRAGSVHQTNHTDSDLIADIIELRLDDNLAALSGCGSVGNTGHNILDGSFGDLLGLCDGGSQQVLDLIEAYIDFALRGSSGDEGISIVNPCGFAADNRSVINILQSFDFCGQFGQLSKINRNADELVCGNGQRSSIDGTERCSHLAQRKCSTGNGCEGTLKKCFVHSNLSLISILCTRCSSTRRSRPSV